MTAETIPTDFFNAFADYVHQRKDEIGRQWMREVRESADVPSSIDFSAKALSDRVPEVMDELVEQLRNQFVDRAETAQHARSHGREQWGAGSNISELIWEIYIIRRILADKALPEFCKSRPDFSGKEAERAQGLMHEFFHRVTCESVTQFASENERKLTEANQALRVSAEARDRVTRSVSHELRNMVHALSLATQLMGGASTEKERRETAVMSAGVIADMSAVLNELLEYSRTVAAGANPILSTISLPDLLDEIGHEWRGLAEEQGLRFEQTCDPMLGEVVTSKLKLKQIAGNLLSNAIKYRKTDEEGYVGMSFTPHGPGHWKLIVADTGLGLTPEDLQELFGAFQRVRPSASVGGSGLGLSLCKEFAELLGGRIEVQSQFGQGARFEVTLPLNRPAAASRPAAPPAQLSHFLEDAGQPPFAVL